MLPTCWLATFSRRQVNCAAGWSHWGEEEEEEEEEEGEGEEEEEEGGEEKEEQTHDLCIFPSKALRLLKTLHTTAHSRCVVERSITEAAACHSTIHGQRRP